MNCPQCQSDLLKVIDSRDVESEPSVRRRRECESCGYRFTTYERIEVPQLWVVKRDGQREAFDRGKVSRGVWRACEKRPIPERDIEALVSAVEQDLRAMHESEVPAKLVGERVMHHLKNLDHIAYIRFASVYRQFADLGELQAEVTKTLRDTTKPDSPNIKQLTK